MALATSKAYSSPFHDSFDVQTGDGSIGEDEFVAVNAMGEVSASDCKEAFNKMTNNGSVDLTRDVFTKLFNEYFASDDVNAGGNFIFGRLKF